VRDLKQSTATNVMLFVADSADPSAGKTGLTLTVTASKDGGAFASISPTQTERGNGWYNLALTTAHTDTFGDLVVRATATGAIPAERGFVVVAFDAADAVRLGLSSLPNATAGNASGLPIKSDLPVAPDNASIATAAGAAGIAASEATAAAADAASAAASALSAATDAAALLAAYVAPLDATETAAAVWDTLTADHVTPGTMGETQGVPVGYLNEITDAVWTAPDRTLTETGSSDPAMHTGTLRAGAARSATLAADAPAFDLAGCTLAITSGTGAGQSQSIRAYNTTTKVATQGEPWPVTPDATSVYSVTFSSAYPEALHRGRLVTAATRSATLATDAPAVDLTGSTLAIVNGTGAGQAVAVIAYNTTTKAAVLASDWTVIPAAGDEYTVRHNLATDYAIRRGNLAAATSSSITFESPGPGGDLTGTDLVVSITDGAGVGQSRRIVGYNSNTRVADVAPAWFAPPDAGDRYVLHSAARVALPYDGLDAIAVAEPTGLATTFVGMLVQLWRDTFKKKTYDANVGRIDRFADNGTTVRLRQSATASSNVETQGEAGPP
jgi:hypothetical protein